MGARRGFGLVLAGGAARGAYQAGVLRFLTRDLPRRLGFVPWPDIVSGTSVGSLNGVFVAARDLDGIERLNALWRQLTVEQVYRFGLAQFADFLKAPFRSNEPFALLDASPLAALIDAQFPHDALRRSIGTGATRAFIISATELATGRNALFVDAAERGVLRDPAPQSRVHYTPIQPVHCLASASIPFCFRPVALDGRFHVDGGLRMNTPLRPVLKAGADRALVVSLLQGSARAHLHQDAVPNLFFLGGKTFNALLLDPVERDLHAATQLNRIVRWGSDRYGPGFADAMEEDLQIREVETLFVRPSVDLGQLAADLYREHRPRSSPLVGMLLARIADRANAAEADLLSYLFFDRVFTGALEALGFEDARRMEEDIVALIGAEPGATR